MATTVSVEVDFTNDGTWVDITAYVLHVKTSQGILEDRPDLLTAGIGTLTLILNNKDKRFSPAYTSGPYYGNLLPNRPVRLRATDGVTTWDVWTGFVREIDPNPGETGPYLARMKCEDALGQLYAAKFSVPLQQDETGDTILKKVLAEAYKTGRASGAFTFKESVTLGDRVVINGTPFNFVPSLTGGDNEVLFGTAGNDAPSNLLAAISEGEGKGTIYSNDITRLDNVTAEAKDAYGQSTISFSLGLGLNPGGVDYVSQEIVLDDAMPVSSVWLYVGKVGAPGFDLDCGIYDAYTGGSLIDANATFTITAGDVSTTPGWVEFSFADEITLPKDNSVWLRLDPDGSNGSAYYTWGYVTSQILADTKIWYYSYTAGVPQVFLYNMAFYFAGTVTIQANARGTWGNAITLAAGTLRDLVESATLNVGTAAAGTYASTWHQDGVYYQIGEIASTPGFDLELNFAVTAGVAGQTFGLYGRYGGSVGHTVNVDAWNGSTWDNLGTLPYSASDALHTFTLDATHTESNNVRVRIYHASPGNATHNLYIDYAYVVVDGLVASDNVTASGSTLSGGADFSPVSLQAGANSFEFAGDTWREAETNVFRMIQDVTKAEWGMFWIDRDGTLTWKNRKYFFGLASATAALTLSTATSTKHLDQRGRITADSVFNRVTVRNRPRIEESSVGVVARSGSPIRVGPRSGVVRWSPEVEYTEDDTVIRLPFVEEDTGDVIGAKDLITPVRTTDYTLNTLPDGSGEDYTNYQGFTVSFVQTASGVEVAFKNNAIGDLYVIDFQVRGVRLISRDQQEIIKEDATSIADYGQRDLTVELPFFTSQIFADALAGYQLSRWKTPTYRVEDVVISARHDNALIEGTSTNLFALKIGDVIVLTEGQTGVTAEKYMITGIEYTIQVGKHYIARLMLRKVSDVAYWLLGVSGYTELGQTTRLGL